MESSYKKVYFDKYCQDCTYAYNKEEEYPCCECLNEPVNVDSHKPIKWDAAKITIPFMESKSIFLEGEI